jgi:hypothetical protein
MLHMFRVLAHAHALLLLADKDLHQLSESLTPRQVFNAKTECVLEIDQLGVKSRAAIFSHAKLCDGFRAP